MTAVFKPSIKQKFALFSYSCVWLLLIPAAILHFVIQMLRGKAGYTRLRLSRYGWVSSENSCVDGFLIHCASVGEVVAIKDLVEQLLHIHPDKPIMITTNTTTGADRVKLLFSDQVQHAYLPYDFPLFHKLFLAKTRPAKLLINEMELWPNLCDQCWRKQIPIFIINGRMSDKSLQTYSKLPALFSPMFTKISAICAQSQRDYDNYQTLNIDAKKLNLTNNIKFDLKLSQGDLNESEQIHQAFNLAGRLILVAGSTHDPEEKILLEAYLELVQHYPNLLLIIVPRHPQRFTKVKSLLAKLHINSVSMSDKTPCQAETQVLLCDQMGKLRAIYHLADIAFVGGSIAQRGGHNALEPAAVGVPILMGTSTYNNPAICNALTLSGALHTVSDAKQVKEACMFLLNDSQSSLQQGQNAKLVIEQNSGAIKNTLNVLARF